MWWALIIGLCAGSFLNVLIDRSPAGESVIWGRSRCDHCKKTLRWYELIPLLSFFLQAGRCRRCHKKLSWQYPIVELITAIGFAILFSFSSHWLIGLLAYWLIFSSLLVIFVSDLKYQIIPDSMVVVATLSVLVILIFRGIGIRSFEGYALAAFAAALFFWILWFLTRGRGIGLGDVKLAFVLGLFLGYPAVVIALYLAFLTGAATGVILMILGKKTLKSTIAFGPFLIVGSALALLFETPIIAWWQALL